MHHTDGPRPLVLAPEDVPLIEAVPLAERGLPESTYALLCRTAAEFPDTPALHLLGEGGRPWRDPVTWTYADLLGRVHQAANLLTSLGVRPGGVTGMMLPNSGQMYAALLGAQAVGIANPVNPALAEEHAARILARTGAEILLTTDESKDKAERIAEQVPGIRGVLVVGGDFDERAAQQPADRLLAQHRPGPDDICGYFHTGGTTGVPKIAPHTHAMEVYMAWALGCSGAYLGDAVVLGGLPLFHVNAVHVTGLGPFFHARTIVSLGPRGYRDKELMADFWRIVEHFRITAFSAVPTVYASLPPVPDDADLSSLRAGAVGAAPLPGRVRTGFEASAKVPMLEGYGLTEATCATSTTPAFAPRAGSVGLRLPYQQAKAVRVDADDRPVADCAPGETGVLVVAGAAVFPGYLGPDGPDPTGKVFDGWLNTGDLGRVDADGYLYLDGRAKDLIIRGGHNIDPRPVEEALLGHPEVTGAAVVGRPDPHAGEVPVAYVTVRTAPDGTRAATEEDVLAWGAAHAPEPAAAPKAVHILDELPVTAIGKPHKTALVADTVRRIVEGVLAAEGLGGTVEVVAEDGRPVAVLGGVEPTARVVAALDRYPFAHRMADQASDRAPD
ncbi:AMP-binding protein [Yinghuangia soli]|uniref:AMP-binding protein n=1 Tax=Yinghuangia soli TaxID=2908204 RepID=A0AA41U235_9ACTN|nr:AMP-binding protein [Yinghuangia soli]MCF2530265.1 AMP-binding protein [Yinghuangia soli]